jgi:hypothetical protein
MSGALEQLTDLLREDGSVIADHLPEAGVENGAAPLAELVAAGPRAAEAPDEYALLVEAVREGYLLHYGEPRVVRAADEDLRLLAGDYLYALGLERLAGLGDLEAVRELADLISISAQLHAERGGAGSRGPAHERAKDRLRSGDEGAERDLLALATETATDTGLDRALARLAESIESAPLG